MIVLAGTTSGTDFRYTAEYWVKLAQCDGVLSIIREEMEILLIRMDRLVYNVLVCKNTLA